MQQKRSQSGFALVELMVVVAIVGILMAIFIPNFANWKNRRHGVANQPVSTSGVKKAEVKVQTGSDGLTVEQRQIGRRLMEDNKPGAIKHLYVISAYSGQAILYSTVRGKVTSGGKRLTPTTVTSEDGELVAGDMKGISVNIGGENHRTSEVLQDDGTYGHSGEYLYWWDVRDVFHQHYISGGQIVHISNQPMAFKNIIVNLELMSSSN